MRRSRRPKPETPSGSRSPTGYGRETPFSRSSADSRVVASGKGPFVSPSTCRAAVLGGLSILCLLSGLAIAGATGSQPYAYLFPGELHALTEHLQRANIKVHELREDIDL